MNALDQGVRNVNYHEQSIYKISISGDHKEDAISIFCFLVPPQLHPPRRFWFADIVERQMGFACDNF